MPLNRFLLVVLCSIVVSYPLFAQVTSLGIVGGYHYVMNTSSIDVLYGSDDCGEFANGTGSGFYAGITGEYSVLGDLLELRGGLSLSMRPASLQTRSVDNLEVFDPTTNSYVPFIREHAFSSTPGYLVVDIGVRSKPLANLPLIARIAFDAGNPVLDATYTQTEEILEPSSVLFPGDVKRRTMGSGEFPGMTSAYGATVALGAVLDLSHNLQLSPEISYRMGLNSITTADTWNQSMISAGIQLRYRLQDQPPPPPPTPEPEPTPVIVEQPVIQTPVPDLPVPPPVTIVSLQTVPLDILETVVTQTYPLLPYVFFEPGSAQITSKYSVKGSVGGFDEKDLPKQTLPIYYSVLDIVGNRMIQNPKSILTVTGTTDGKELASPEERKKLAEERAKTIVQLLSTKWNIPTKRFITRTVDKPTLLSSEKYDQGYEENRRVELSSSDVSILGPVLHTRFNEYLPTQPNHTFSVGIRNPEVSNSWKLKIYKNGSEVGTQQGSGIPPQQITYVLTQENTNRLGPLLATTDSLNAELDVVQRDGSIVKAQTTFPITKTMSNYEVSRLSLIVFDFDRSAISDQNRAMMSTVVNTATKEGSTAVVIGSTDKLGELPHNMELSGARATSVAEYVKTIAPTLTLKEVRGIGPSELPYSNDLPEGRFYCRTVSLTITTPVR